MVRGSIDHNEPRGAVDLCIDLLAKSGGARVSERSSP